MTSSDDRYLLPSAQVKDQITTRMRRATGAMSASLEAQMLGVDGVGRVRRLRESLGVPGEGMSGLSGFLEEAP